MKQTRGANRAGKRADLTRQKLFSKPVTLNVDTKVVGGNAVLIYPDQSTVTLISVTDINGGIFA